MIYFKIHIGTNIDAWLRDHFEFKKGGCMEMIDPEGYYHEICRYGTIKNFAPTNKLPATVA